MSDTPKPVLVQVAPNQVTYGFYTVTEDVLTMAHEDGQPVELSGMTFTHNLKTGDNPDAIAAVLTGQIRKMMQGEIVPGFNDPLSYPMQGVA